MHVDLDHFRGKSCLVAVVVGGLFVMLKMVGEVDVRLRWRKRDMLGMFWSAFFFIPFQLNVSQDMLKIVQYIQGVYGR